MDTVKQRLLELEAKAQCILDIARSLQRESEEAIRINAAKLQQIEEKRVVTSDQS